MKFLVDECVSSRVYNWLRTQGYDTVAIVEILPSVKDIGVLALAQQEQRVLITRDKDFGELVFRDHNAHFGIILLRLQTYQADAEVDVLNNLLVKYRGEISNNFIVVTEKYTRIFRG